MTDTQDYQRLHEIFAAVCELTEPGRGAELARRCGDDEALRQQVNALLKYHNDDDDFLDRPVVASASGGGGDNGSGPDTNLHRLSEKPGDLIGPYKLLQTIGEGGFGVVYMAEQKEPVRRKVALKIIKLGMDTKQVIARFEAERQALAMMEHPNIARVFDAGATSEGRPYFVMELVKGEPVTTYCDRNNLTTLQRLDIFQQVCHAVQHAHQKGIIHRDIKPSNVLVTIADGRPMPKVIDFGIAKATNRELTDKTLFTEFHQLIGTPEYMSPEQAEMTGVDIDTRSDIYSLGVLLYELLTGTTPFDPRKLRSVAYGEIQRIIREEEPPKPSTRLYELITNSSPQTPAPPAPLPAAPEGDDHSSILYIARHRQSEPSSLSKIMRGDLDWIVMKCLEKDRTRRYETANGLAADIQRYVTDEPVLAGAPGVAYKFSKFVRRNRTGVFAASIVLFVLLAGMAGTSWGMVQATAARDATQVALTLAEQREQEADTARAQEQQRADDLVQVVEFLALQLLTLDEIVFERALVAVDEMFTNEPLLRALLLQRVADELTNLGLFERATRPATEALAIRRRVLGDEHTDTLESMGNMGAVLQGQGHLDKAETYYQEAIAIHRRVLGDEHSATIGLINNMSWFLHYGKFAEAESYYLKAIALHRRVLGDEHSDTIGLLRGMGWLLQNQYRPDEAEPYFREVLESYRRVRGNEDHETLRLIMFMGRVLKNQGKNEKAEPYFREALETRRRILGNDNFLTRSATNFLGSVLNAQGRYAESEPILRESLEQGINVFDADHWIVAETRSLLGESAAGQERFDEAEPLLLEGYTGLGSSLSPDEFQGNKQLPLAIERLIKLYDAWGNPDKAAQWRARLAATDSD